MINKKWLFVVLAMLSLIVVGWLFYKKELTNKKPVETTAGLTKKGNNEFQTNSYNGLFIDIPKTWIRQDTKLGPIYKNIDGSIVIAIHIDKASCFKSLSDFKNSIIKIYPKITSFKETLEKNGQTKYVAMGQIKKDNEILEITSILIIGKVNSYSISIVAGGISYLQDSSLFSAIENSIYLKEDKDTIPSKECVR